MATTKQIQVPRRSARSPTFRPRPAPRLASRAAAVAQRKRTGGKSPKTRQELYDEAKRRNLPGRSKRGRAEFARALGHD